MEAREPEQPALFSGGRLNPDGRVSPIQTDGTVCGCGHEQIEHGTFGCDECDCKETPLTLEAGPEASASARPDPGRVMEGRYHHDGPSTERAAARRVAPRAGSQRARVLEALRQRLARGATDYELWNDWSIGARPHVPGTRREELIADGWPIKDSGTRRRTDTGAAAIVWVLAEDL
jgi:hypothetical protein